MGNREDLLAGARKVIVERGVAKATARDIASAAGVSLAAIGYHFGSKEALITEALAESLGNSIGDGMDALIRESTGTPLLRAFAHLWNEMPKVFQENRDYMTASLENMVRVVRSPRDQQFYADQMPGMYREMVALLRDTHPQLNEEQAYAIAQLNWVLVQGLGMLSVVMPDAELPDGDRLAEAVAVLAGYSGAQTNTSDT
ncbi:TetR/AcrR family transcriptional regulator [Nocardia arthritidis]|uniref:TetR family transcriptional regulator n=1 Tax=Nocardia arthritidis TaxID=228602 RepID=A0A6G9YGF6_9NOCA|nr:TetR/AcrR family transcriptional regulator [Nocardia arthritidis]QIS12053.1 TetR family transcriptional regulator [Nocardia arthritidis]